MQHFCPADAPVPAAAGSDTEDEVDAGSLTALKRKYSGLYDAFKDVKVQLKELRKINQDMKKDYDNKFAVNGAMVISMEDRIKELEDWNKEEEGTSAPTSAAAAGPSSKRSGSADIGI